MRVPASLSLGGVSVFPDRSTPILPTRRGVPQMLMRLCLGPSRSVVELVIGCGLAPWSVSGQAGVRGG